MRAADAIFSDYPVHSNCKRYRRYICIIITKPSHALKLLVKLLASGGARLTSWWAGLLLESAARLLCSASADVACPFALYLFRALEYTANISQDLCISPQLNIDLSDVHVSSA